MFRLRLFLLAILTFAASISSAEIVLRMASWEGDVALRIQRDAIDIFEQRHPGIRVKLENVDNGVYVQKLLTETAANVAPDVAMMGYEKFQPFAKRKVLLPLDKLAAGPDGVDLSQFYKQIIDVHRFDGSLYVLPRDIAPMGLIFYNKKLFRDAGIPYPDGTWTWDFKERPELKDKDFLWVMHRLTNFGCGRQPRPMGFCLRLAGSFCPVPCSSHRRARVRRLQEPHQGDLQLARHGQGLFV